MTRLVCVEVDLLFHYFTGGFNEGLFSSYILETVALVSGLVSGGAYIAGWFIFQQSARSPIHNILIQAHPGPQRLF